MGIGQIVQISGEQPYREGYGEGGVAEHQRGGVVQQPHLAHDGEQRDQQQHRGEHVVGQEQHHQRLAAHEAEAREGVGRQRGDRQRDQRGDERHDQAVLHRVQEVVLAEQVAVGLEAGVLGPVDDLQAVQLLRELQAGHEGPVEREQQKHQEDHQRHPEQEDAAELLLQQALLFKLFAIHTLSPPDPGMYCAGRESPPAAAPASA